MSKSNPQTMIDIDRCRSEEAAGQILMVGFEGVKYTSSLGSLFKRLRPGGVILFSRNIETARQTAILTSDLRKLCEDITAVTPFIAVDQEGGRVSRLPQDINSYMAQEHGATEPLKETTARALGDDGSEEQVEKVYRDMGRVLRTLGFNLDFAPVLDLDTNSENPIIGDRSFSGDAPKVCCLGKSAISGLRAEGILSCGKHFPGHGDTALDSHLDLPVDGRPKERLMDMELRPFEATIEDAVEFIMTAHVLYPALDDKLPATLSRKIVNDILREAMGYEGVIVTDDLDMKAITTRYEDGKAVELALTAGCDQLLACKDTRRQETAFYTARRMIDEGKLPETELKLKLNRLLKAKQAIGIAGD